MNWRAITFADIAGVLTGPEVAACQRAAKASGQTNPVEEMRVMVTQWARGLIGIHNTLDADEDALPVAAILQVCALWRNRCLTRLDLPISDPRQAEADKAMDWFNGAVATGKVTFTKPETAAPSTAQPSLAATPALSAQERTEAVDL